MRRKKTTGFIQDDSMTDAEKLSFAFDFLQARFEARKNTGRPSQQVLNTFPEIEEIFDVARKL